MNNLPQVPVTMNQSHALFAQRVLAQIPRGRTADSIEQMIDSDWTRYPNSDSLVAYGRALVAALRAA